MNTYAVIMAGGSGTRLWPLSKKGNPKQSQKIFSNLTMFQEAIERIVPLFSYENIFVSTGEEYAPDLIEQCRNIPVENFIIEPEGRGTAACIALSAVHIRKRDKNGIMVVLTADHFIEDHVKFRKSLVAGMEMAREGFLVTLGIKPTYPSTGYGYIKEGEKIKTVTGIPVFRVEKFVEKPDIEAAKTMYSSDRYSWNSGMFIWKISDILDEFKEQMLDLYRNIIKIENSIGSDDYVSVLETNWIGIQKQTIDYGIMEGARNVAVLPVDFGWSDVGSWSRVYEILSKNKNCNVVKGNHIGINTQNCLIFSDKRVIATIGLTDLIIVDTPDALLVCNKTQDQMVRKIVKALEKINRLYEE